MTRKDFEVVAEIVCGAINQRLISDIDHFIDLVCMKLGGHYSNFNEKKFRDWVNKRIEK